MSEQNATKTIADLAHERGLFLHDLGPRSTVMLYNTGRRLPGAKGLRRMADALSLDPLDLMAVCRAAVERRQQVAP